MEISTSSTPSFTRYRNGCYKNVEEKEAKKLKELQGENLKKIKNNEKYNVK